MTSSYAYNGPQCPHCEMPLDAEHARTGIIHCPHCMRTFEATAFTPPQRTHRAVELAGTGPDESAVCANHARNAAVTSCDRCGLFICALCELNIGTAAYCPACFERMRTEGTLTGSPVKYRNYAMQAVVALVAGVFCSFLALPLGALALYYSRKGMKQRIDEGRSTAGMIVAMIFAILEILGGLALVGVVIWAMFEGASQ
jgi:uncharacterized paraquat-inducible protein A